MPGYLRLLDSSRCQGLPTWLDWARDQGIAGLIAKASEGVSYRDPEWPATARAASVAGLPLGAYGVLRDRGLGLAEAQARLFVDLVRGVELQLPLVLDWELNSAQVSDDDLVAAALRWCEVVEEELERDVVIYSGIGHVGALRLSPTGRAQLEELATRRLWCADYGRRASVQVTPETWSPRIPRPWAEAWLWQSGPAGAFLPGPAHGIPVDVNWYHGTIGELLGIDEAPAPVAQRP